MDDQQRERIRDDLKGFFKGDLRFDDLSRALYSTDASIFQIRPLGVALPRDEEDVQALVRYAAENKVPLIARGAGTGVAGESLGNGLIVDLSCHFRTIVEVGSDTVRVQPGVIGKALNQRLAQEGRRFAPDPASGHICTIGGMLANNASGAHALRHGYTRDHVQSLRVVLDSGDAVDVGREPLSAASQQARHWQDMVTALEVLLEQNRELIHTQRPRTPYNRCGYLLHDVHLGQALDMPKLLVGSEGTLGLFTEATLRTIPLPGGRALVLLGFASVEAALRGAQRSLATKPAACELIDRRLLSLARGSVASEVAALVPPAAEAALLIEYEADTPWDARRQACDVAHLLEKSDSALHVIHAFEPAELERLWQLREVALPSLYGIKGGAQPVPFIEDVAVPVDRLLEFLLRIQDILQEKETTASYLIHAGTGQVHTRPFLDLQRPEDVTKLTALAEDIHSLALDMGGTVSTQHGTGLARTPWVARQYGALYPVFRQIKSIFDPQGIFNPGKIVDPTPRMLAWPLRKLPTPAAVSLPWHLQWHNGELIKEANHCNGCGQCRTESPSQRMCPIFRATHQEEASPRAKGNLLRHVLLEGNDGLLASNQVRAIADLCVNCKMCGLECPARVDIPKLMLETKAANVARHGLDRTEWFLARLENFVRWGHSFVTLTNLALGNRLGRWLLERLFHLSGRRRLPRLARRTFLSVARRRGWTSRPQPGAPCVALFVDLYANYFDPQVPEAAVAVLKHNGFDVYVPPEQRGCGMEALAHGDIDTARDIVLSNVRALAESAREGWPIVCLEPTAALMLRKDMLDLTDDPDARLVAPLAVEFSAFMADLHRRGKLRTDFRPLPMNLGHHVPCHVKALGPTAAGPDVLRLIPGLNVHTLDVSCSGMAGTFGLKKENYQTSLDAGQPMLAELARPDLRCGSSECSPCRMQMENAAGKRALHPAQFLAWSYGLMPQVQGRLEEPLRDLLLR